MEIIFYLIILAFLIYVIWDLYAYRVTYIDDTKNVHKTEGNPYRYMTYYTSTGAVGVAEEGRMFLAWELSYGDSKESRSMRAISKHIRRHGKWAEGSPIDRDILEEEFKDFKKK